MLHLITASPFQNTSMRDCLKIAQPGDAIVLLADAVYAATVELAPHAQIDIFALAEQMQTRGIIPPNWLQTINCDELVALTCRHHPVKTWV